MGSGGAEHRGEDDAGGESGVEVRPDGAVGHALFDAAPHFVHHPPAHGQNLRVVGGDGVGQKGRAAQEGQKAGVFPSGEFEDY